MTTPPDHRSANSWFDAVENVMQHMAVGDPDTIREILGKHGYPSDIIEEHIRTLAAGRFHIIRTHEVN